MLSNETILQKTEAAFLPLRCVAEVWDYGQKLRFRVFDNEDAPVVTFPEEPIEPLRQRSALQNLLSAARREVEQKGHELLPWQS